MNKLKRYILFLIGLFVNALGVSLVTKASLGTSPISSIPYVLSLNFPFTLGNFTIVFSILLIVLQILILRKNFKLENILQIPVSIAFGYFIDLTMYMLFWINPQNYFVKMIALLAGCLVLGLGVYLEVLADVVMLPGESFVRAIVQTWTLHRDWESQIFNITKGFVMLDADSNPGKTISESVYRIKSSVDENFEVNISGNGNETGTNVQVWSEESNNPYFQFAFVYMDDGYYMIISEGSGLALEVSGSGEGANIQQGKITGESNQMFRVHSAGENYYYLVPKSDPAMCVDLQGANAENGTNVEIWTSLQNRAQIWKLEKHDEKCKPVLWTDLSAVKENETVTVNYAGVSDYSQVMLHVLKDGKEESSKDVTGTKEYKLSFEKEGTYELYVSGSSNGQWYDSRHTEIEVTADKPSVIMEVKGFVLTATITKPEKVKYQGIVYGTTKDVSLDTKGRTRVVFTKIAADGTISLDASALKGKNYYFRAYIIYENANGNEVKEYSDAVTLSNTK